MGNHFENYHGYSTTHVIKSISTYIVENFWAFPAIPKYISVDAQDRSYSAYMFSENGRSAWYNFTIIHGFYMYMSVFV